jgi:hypothetical protein
LKTLRLLTALALVTALATPPPANGYSVLTHEAIIDSVWDTNIQKLLLKRYPHSTPEDLRKAHAFAYGGAIIQDLGYYPHGNKLFSDLTHYVRSGDFIQALLRDAQNLNEYAFAVGSVAHYASDNSGHRLATNRSVPILYPKLGKKFGPVVTYADDPNSHLKTEFGFDVLEVAKGRYASQAYHDFIGFSVAQELLDRAFLETYGITVKSLIKDEEEAISSYRHSVGSLIPEATRIAWELKKDDIQKDTPGLTRNKFLYNLKRSSYEQEFGKNYQKPTFKEKFLAWLTRILPKIGPLKALAFRTPTPQTEKLLEESFNKTLDSYRGYLTELSEGEHIVLPNDNFDVGAATTRGEYTLADAAYSRLLEKLAETQFAQITPETREDILNFYATIPATPTRPTKNKKLDAKAEAKLKENLAALQNLKINSTTAATPKT